MAANRMARLVLGLLLASVLIFVHARGLASGVDLFDESVYVAIPYRFVLGDRPFVDEVNPIQCAALVSTPLVRAIVWMLDGTNGIVIATRIACFLFECLVAGLVVVLLRPRLGGAVALVIAIAAVVIAPGRANLSYNSLLATFSTLGLVLAALAHERRRPALLPAAGAALALACVAYPPAVFGALVLAVLLGRVGGRRCAMLLVAGMLAVAVLMLPVVLDVGRETLNYSGDHLAARGTWLRRLWRIPAHVWATIPLPFLSGVGTAVLLLACRGRAARAGVFVAACLPALAWVDLGHKSAIWSTALVGACAPLLAIPLWRVDWFRTLFLLIGLPAAVTACFVAYSSSSGVLQTGHALAPASIVTLVGCTIALGRSFAFARAAAPWGGGFVASLAFALVVLSGDADVQNEAPVALRTARVEDGPYRGLWTTPRKRALVENLGADLGELDDGRRRLLCYYLLPGGYLMTSMRPASNNAWGLYCYPARLQWQCLEPYVENLARFGGSGVVVVKLRQGVDERGELRKEPTGPADDWIPAHARLVLDRPQYSIFLAP